MKSKILAIVLLAIFALSGCVTLGTLDNPLRESFLERADGSIVGHSTFRSSVDNAVGFLTFYEKGEDGRLIVKKESEPTTTPTVMGQTITGATTAFFGSAPIAAGMVGGQALAASAAKSIARGNVAVAREGIEASKHAAPSTIFNLVPIANSSSESLSNIFSETSWGIGNALEFAE